MSAFAEIKEMILYFSIGALPALTPCTGLAQYVRVPFESHAQTAASLPAPAGDAAIVVVAEVRASREDGEVPHFEPIIAASPVDPNILIAAASAWPLYGPTHHRMYISLDRGVTWRNTVIPELAEHGDGDPMVAVGPTGILYFVAIDNKFLTDVAYRSADNGRTWEGPVTIGPMDRETLAIDPGSPRFGGRVYIIGNGSPPHLYYSIDQGRTLQAGESNEEVCVKQWLTILSDGTLFVACSKYGNPVYGRAASQFGFITSEDGGRTFSDFHVLAPYVVPPDGEAEKLIDKGALFVPPSGGADGNTPCVADTGPGAYHDRVYCLWPQTNLATLTQQFVLAYSSDKGVTWSTPKPVDPSLPGWATQALASLAVNKDGTVAVAWLDTRQSQKRDRHDEYFTASRDGGATFLPSVRVSSRSSFPLSAGNVQVPLNPLPDAVDTKSTSTEPNPSKGGELIAGRSAYATRPAGGEYAGMAADASGDFHPVWLDARTGTWQVYVARIQVAKPNEVLGHSVPDASEGVRASLDGASAIQIESSTFDPVTGEVTIWAQIQNSTDNTLYGPFAVEVVNPPDDDIAFKILNASNGKPGAGAEFDYAGAAGTLDFLPPGGVSAARPWRLRLNNLQSAIFMRTTVRAFVRDPLADR